MLDNRRLSLLVGVFAISAGILFGQDTTGTIVGTIRDASGAAMPNVSVTVRNVATNSIRTVRANGSGDYSVPLLPPGAYEIAAEQSGFQKAVYSGVNLEINQTVRVDATLQVGSQNQRVEVTAAGPLIQTDMTQNPKTDPPGTGVR
jgi:Carboxypeptidase regulatory-like domain